MTGWRPALYALLIWAAHFFVAYGLMLIFPVADWVGMLVIGLGVACFACLALNYRAAPSAATLRAATLLSAVAIFWQSIVGLF